MRHSSKATTLRVCCLAVVLLLSGISVSGFGQSKPAGKYWIFLAQRTSTNLTPAELGITERALKRRAKVLPPSKLIDEYDEPVSSTAVTQLRATGATIRTVSRWLNAVSVEATDAELQAIQSIPGVVRTKPVLALVSPRPEGSSSPTRRNSGLQKSASLNYGDSFTQLNTIGIVSLHNVGINGTGVLLGMLDDGFNNHRVHDALKNIRVVAEYDFIHNIPDTQLQPWEDPQQGVHGAGTLSSIAGYAPGSLIGGAFGVSVVLAKTEMDSSGNSADFSSEEDTYVAGLEWMERLGVDIASSSLGYKEFLPPDTSYSFNSMDGHVTVVSKAASIAAQKGVLLCTAMGNEGTQIGSNSFAVGTIVAPADADSIVAVGATSLDGSVFASFSGTGPTADGRTKPEVVAPGENVTWAYGNSTNQYWTVNGTSAATPLTASAAALVLSAHPQLTPMQVRAALTSTAVPLSAEFPSLAVPNNYFGYGLVNAYDAVLHDGLAFGNSPIITVTDSQYVVTTWIISGSSLDASSLVLRYRNAADSVFTQVPLRATSTTPNEYQAVVPIPPTGVTFLGYFSARSAGGVLTSPSNAPSFQHPIRCANTIRQSTES
jgi:serine protease AprX